MRWTRRPVFTLIEAASSSSRRTAARLDSRARQRVRQPRTARIVKSPDTRPANPSAAPATLRNVLRFMLCILVDERLGRTWGLWVRTAVGLRRRFAGRLLAVAPRSSRPVHGRNLVRDGTPRIQARIAQTQHFPHRLQ